MSALVGTPLEAALRDRGVTTLALVGAVLEIGIEPTARHAADLGFLPVVVEDACGIVDACSCGTVPGEPGLQPAELPLLHGGPRRGLPALSADERTCQCRVGR